MNVNKKGRIKKLKKTFEEQHKLMTETPVNRLVISMSVPAVASQLMTVIYNTADTWFVSKIGTSASAAVGVVFSMMSIIQAFGFGIGMGTGSLISLNLGEKKNEEAEFYASSGLAASFILGAIVGIFGLIFLKPLMLLLGSTETMLPYSCSYAKYIFLSAPVMCSSFVMNNIIRAEGDAVYGMFGLCIGGLINIALDPLFIFVLDMGIGGAAIATALSHLIGFIILLIPFLNGRSIVRIGFRKIDKSYKRYLKIVTTGIPTVFRQSLGSVSTALLNRKARIYGDAAVAAITIANKIFVLVRNMIIGFGQGFMPVAGYNFGNGNRKRTKEAFRFSTVLGSCVCICSAILISRFPGEIIQFFRDDPEVVEIGTLALKFCCAVMPFMAYSTFINQLYQCLGFKLPATVLASCRQGIFFIPSLFILTHYLGLKGVQMAQPMGDLLTFVISIPFGIYFIKKQLAEGEKQL